MQSFKENWSEKYKKAWAVIQTWEGVWKPYHKKDVTCDEGDYVVLGYDKENKSIRKCAEIHYAGTNFGLTSEFLNDFQGWSNAKCKSDIQKLDEEQAGEIWRKTQWKAVQGDKIINDDIAAFIFDYVIQKNNAAFFGIEQVLGEVYGFEVPKDRTNYKSNYVKAKKFISINPRYRNNTDGFYYFTDEAIRYINGVSDPAYLLVLLKKNRLKVSRGNYSDRINAFNIGKSITRKEHEENKDKDQTKKGQKRKIVNETEKTDNTGLYIGLGLLALWVLKRRRKA